MWTNFIYGFADGLTWLLDGFYDNIGNIFNYTAVAVGLIGMLIWLGYQAKFNKEAAENKDQIK